MEEINKKYLVGLSFFTKFGPKKLALLDKYFKSDYKKAYSSSVLELEKAQIESKLAQEFVLWRENIDLDKKYEIIKNENISVINLNSEEYPSLLKEIFDPPFILYYKGNINIEGPSLAVVGSRNVSGYAKEVTAKVVGYLATNSISIVSGLALGVDAVAHSTTLENGGKTIAVLGTGIDKQSLYPAMNRFLAQKIVDNKGLLMSEFPPGTPPLKHHFPQRNRIVSGLSLGTIVIEARERSGALITARFALEQNREVFAVPGSIFSENSKGTNELIKKGATPIVSGEDVLDALNLSQIKTYIEKDKILPENELESEILKALENDSMHVDELMRLTKNEIGVINSTLTLMEIKGMIKNVGNMIYIKC